MLNELLFETSNPFDLPPEELIPLARDVARDLPGVPVTIGFEDEEGSGVAFIFVLHLFLPSAEFVKDAIYTTICTKILNYFKDHRAKEHQSKRNHNLVVHDEDGETVEIRSLRPESDEFEILPPDDEFIRPKPTKRIDPEMDETES